MPDSCCAVGCANRREKGSVKSFYRIPSERHGHRKKLWLTAIKRENWSEKQIKSARICGDHFITGL